MEDRKRSLAVDQDDTPPSKRQATSTNGPAMRMEPEKEKEIEHYQKGAIFRQMKEFKRERNLLETQVAELTKRATWHDDHIRTIDSWFSQLLDEIRILANDQLDTPSASNESDRLPPSLLAEENSIFQEHLKSRSGKIRTAISDIFGKFPSATPDVKELQERMAALLADEKAHLVELQRVTGERDSLAERLENASYRYLVAEKKLDRAKSKAVQEMEQQAIMKREDDGSSAKDKTVKKEGSAETNGDANPEVSATTDLARREAVAAAEKRKVQVEQLEAENKRLNEELTAAKVKSAISSDEDYAKSGLFAVVKTQLEDMVKRLNDLEAANVHLREEAQKLQAERNSYRNQVDEESRATTDENESQIARTEGDLARIRNARDELQAELAVLKSTQGTQQQSLESTKELAAARESRITALESELQRVRLQNGEGTLPDATASLDQLSTEELKAKLRSLESQCALLGNELPSMEAAWKKTQVLAAKKVAEIANWEEQISRLNAEKTKADQKYFSAMKAKDARDNELRALKTQNSKTSEIVTQLKDAETNTRILVSALEKNLSESKDSLTGLSQQNRLLQQKVNESSITSEIFKTEIAKLKELITGKDSAVSQATSAKRTAEVELQECKVRLDETKKQVDVLKKRSAGSSSAEADDWRRVAICPVCNSNLRNTALKLCSHVFCDVCVQNLISHRSRKCPSCGKAFGVNDSMPIILT